MKEPTHPREIKWIVDKQGNNGKTFLSKYMQLQGAVRFENGKSADLKKAYNGQELVIFDLSRSQEDHINYEVMESIKNGTMFSGKYDSQSKLFDIPKVIVFANFYPNEEKLSADRWNIIDLDQCEGSMEHLCC